jgi:hypothetical protein
MNVSDVVLACARDCANLSRQCADEEIAAALLQISMRLLRAAAHDAELVADDAAATPSRLHAAFPAGA